MKKICLIFIAFLLLFSLVACGSKPKEVEVPKEVAEFFTNRKGKENAQILVDALVTDVEQTSAGPSPATIEKYVAFGNGFMMVIDSDYGFAEDSCISFCKGDYTDDPKVAVYKTMGPSKSSSQIDQLEEANKIVIYYIGTGLLESGESYSLVYRKGDDVSVTSWKMDIKGGYYTAEPEFPSHGNICVSPIGVSTDIYLVGDVSMEFSRINVLSENKDVLWTCDLTDFDYEQGELLGDPYIRINALPNKGVDANAIVNLTGASEITIFDRSFKLEKVSAPISD
ncbi:MAG: hypothetical protein MJ092_03995 [Lachnospiraceae bacterium]|nr:hypothetical protein [Lachnospiraceae bacterium]